MLNHLTKCSAIFNQNFLNQTSFSVIFGDSSALRDVQIQNVHEKFKNTNPKATEAKADHRNVGIISLNCRHTKRLGDRMVYNRLNHEDDDDFLLLHLFSLS